MQVLQCLNAIPAATPPQAAHSTSYRAWIHPSMSSIISRNKQYALQYIGMYSQRPQKNINTDKLYKVILQNEVQVTDIAEFFIL